MLPLGPSTGSLRLELIGPAGRFHKAPSQPFPAGEAASPTRSGSGMRPQPHLLHPHSGPPSFLTHSLWCEVMAGFKRLKQSELLILMLSLSFSFNKRK